MRIVFMGTPEAAVPSLRRLIDDGHEVAAVWTQPDKPAGRGKQLHQSPVKQFALANNLAVHQPARIKNEESKASFAAHNADAAVVVAYGKILPTEFLDAPRHGCINVHLSLLPKYRGAAPVNWAIVNGEAETGVTTMRIVAELDAGPILLQTRESIESNETAPQLMSRLAETGADLISETLQRLEQIQPKPQVDSEASFAPILKREDGLIDWSMDAFAIERRVRGFQPWPNAFTRLRSQRVTIWRAAPERSGDQWAPGSVLQSSGEQIVVACGNQTQLRIEELQPEGSRRMSARDFLNGRQVQPGDLFS